MIYMEKNKGYVFEGWREEAVLLLHGATSGASQLRPLANYLNCLGYWVYGVNLAGHGTTKEDLAKTTYLDLIAKAEADYQKVKKRHEKIFVSGLSLGGLLTVYLAAAHNDIAGIVPMATALDFVETCLFAQKHDTEYIHRPTGGKVGLYKQYHIHYEDVPSCFPQAMFDLADNFRDKNLVENITSPALIIHTKDDSTIYAKSSEYVYNHIRSTDKELCLFDSGEHLFVLSEQRYDPFDKIADFLMKRS